MLACVAFASLTSLFVPAFAAAAPSVTIDQAAGQSDPATSGPILFDVVFSEAVTGFTTGDVDLSSSTAGGSLAATVTGSGSTYTLSVSGMTTGGTVVASIPAGVAVNSASIANTASTSTDNTVAFTGPTIPPVANNVSIAVAYGSTNNPITLNITGGAADNVAVATAAGHGLAIVSGTSITYTPNAGYSGPDSFTYTATNTHGTSAPATVTINVSPPTITISPASLPGAIVGTAYSQTLTASGGTGPYNFSVNAGSVPFGTSFSSDGLLSGTPTVASTFNFTVRVTDAYGFTGAQAYSVVVISQTPTTTTLVSSPNPSNAGDPVTFVATVSSLGSSPAPTGTVTFFVDGAAAATVPLAGNTVSLTTSVLTAGTHPVVASYGGDASNAASTSNAVTLEVRAQGSILIRQTVAGGDGSFGFSSPEPSLNFTIETSGGIGASPAVSLQAGAYSVTAADMTGAGFALSSISCNDGDSSGNPASRKATINLAAGESVICTFASTNAREKTADIIEEFMATRAGLILENQPDIQRRIDRLNGAAGGADPLGSLLAYLSGITDSRAVNISGSLAAMRRLGEGAANNVFDVWFAGTYSRFDINDTDGNFGMVTLGADYLLNSNLLIGAFVELDRTDGFTSAAGGTAEGTGWLTGPYLTARLSDNLYLDLLAGAGTSSNRVSPTGTYTDDFDATRWLFSATLQGKWQYDDWTFSPRARFSYFEETSHAYVDSLSVPIPSVATGLGQIAFGPGVSYRYVTDQGIALDFGLRLDGIFKIGDTSADGGGDFHGRAEASVDASMPCGARLRLSVAQGGIGGNSADYLSGRLRVSTPLN
ncbi:hypothetical protein MJ8_29190 [Mesorhizobium sp. J8]|nr:hypothetical protein MJ8_29190 [Mesorhizobium sp. J8]